MGRGEEGMTQSQKIQWVQVQISLIALQQVVAREAAPDAITPLYAEEPDDITI